MGKEAILGYLFVFLTALASGMLLTAVLRALALKFNFVTAGGVTCVGGPAMWLAFSFVCIPYLGFYRLSANVAWGIILSSVPIVAFGIIDDYKKELSVPSKFWTQIAATSLLIIFGIRTQIAYIGSFLNLLITFLWVLGITNAFNHLDISDGLAGGIAAISVGAFFLIALFNADFVIVILSLALAGIILGFLRYNLSSAKVYMGNSGSHLLGFMLAAIALSLSYAPLERKIALLSPLLILGFPIFDTAFLMLMRVKKAKSIFKKSNDHLALRFLRLGYSKNKTLLFILALSLFFSLSGIYLSQASNVMGIIVVILVSIVALALFRKMSKVFIDG